MNLKFWVNIAVLVILIGAVTYLESIVGGNLDLESPYGIGQFVGGIIACVLIPLVVAVIPVGIYWAWKRKMMPRFYGVAWVLWGLLSLMPAFSRIASSQAG